MGIGAQVRFSGADAAAAYAELLADREAIDAEFVAAGFAAPEWRDSEVPVFGITTPSPLPWGDASEDEQRGWMARAANQFVNSLRPRLQRRQQEMAA